jgi:hypothetical protein
VEGLVAGQAAMQQQMQQMQLDMQRMSAVSCNSRIKDEHHPLSALPAADGQVPIDFPVDFAALKALSDMQVSCIYSMALEILVPYTYYIVSVASLHQSSY